MTLAGPFLGDDEQKASDTLANVSLDAVKGCGLL